MKSANAALPAFIAEFNKKFHQEPVRKDKPAFVPLPSGFDLDTLLAAQYNRKTDNSGCFSFQNYTFQVECAKSRKPVVKKDIVFLFSEKLGFKAYYHKTSYNVTFLDFLNKGKQSYLPQVTKRLIHDCFFSSVKNKELSDREVN
jgi:hypothetical protein